MLTGLDPIGDSPIHSPYLGLSLDFGLPVHHRHVKDLFHDEFELQVFRPRYALIFSIDVVVVLHPADTVRYQMLL